MKKHMKRRFAMLLAATLLLALLAPCAVAEMGIQLISGPDTQTEEVSLDDIKIGAKIDIDGYGQFTPTTFEYSDSLSMFNKGSTWNTKALNSGAEADYAILKMDVLNTTTKPRNYLTACEVKVVYDEDFVYKGWFYQYNWNNHDGDNVAQNCPINAEDNFEIDPMYRGHYCFGCTLPNAVVESKAPLYMVITLDGNELTYNIRK